jgi:hypothetical protein
VNSADRALSVRELAHTRCQKEEGMTNGVSDSIAASAQRGRTSLRGIMHAVQSFIVPMLTVFFLVFTFFYAGAALIEFVSPILNQGNVIEGLIKGLNMGVVALAVYELAQIVYEEYETTDARNGRMARMRRGIIRFVSVTCTALVLESLMMVIKYSQQDLAGFLYYPVAIIAAAALLLIALGVYTRLTQGSTDEAPVDATGEPA